MPNHDSGARGSALRLDRTQRSFRSEDRSARVHADETSQCIRVAKRTTDRKAYPKVAPLDERTLTDRLPEPIITHLSVDDICREALLIADLLGRDNIDLN